MAGFTGIEVVLATDTVQAKVLDNPHAFTDEFLGFTVDIRHANAEMVDSLAV